MHYAVKKADGRWTGVSYPVDLPHYRAHHAQYGETVEAVAALRQAEDGSWEADPAPIGDLRASWTITRFQARAALMAAGLLDQVEAAVAAADPQTRLAWAESIEFPRTSPTIAALAGVMGLTDGQLDDLFRAAMQVAA